MAIAYSLITSTAFHVAAQAARFVYPSFEDSNDMPGALVCNLTIVMSIVFGIAAGVIQGTQESALTKQNPDRYPPSLIKHIMDLRKRGEFSCWALLCCKIGASLDAESDKWHAKREMLRLRATARKSISLSREDGSLHGHTSFRHSFLSPRSAAREAAASPVARAAVSPPPKVSWGDDADAKQEADGGGGVIMMDNGVVMSDATAGGMADGKADGTAVSKEGGYPPLAVLSGYYTREADTAGAAVDAASVEPYAFDLARTLEQREQRHYEGLAAQLSVDGGLTLPYAMAGDGGVDLVPVQHEQRLRGKAGAALQHEYELRRADEHERMRMRLSMQQRQLLHGQVGQTTCSMEQGEGAASAPSAEAMPTRLPPLPQSTYQQAMMLAEPHHPPPGARSISFPAGLSLGLSITTDERGRSMVTDVLPGSAAELYDCNVGAELIAVDGLSTVGMNQSEVLSLLTSLTNAHEAPGAPGAATRTLTLVPAPRSRRRGVDNTAPPMQPSPAPAAAGNRQRARRGGRT